MVHPSAGRNGAAPAALVAGSAILTSQDSCGIASASVRGKKEPCEGAPSGQANCIHTIRGLGDPCGRYIPQQTGAGSTLTSHGALLGRRPGTPTLADPLFGGGVPFPGFLLHADAAPRWPSYSQDMLQATPKRPRRGRRSLSAPDRKLPVMRGGEHQARASGLPRQLLAQRARDKRRMNFHTRKEAPGCHAGGLARRDFVPAGPPRPTRAAARHRAPTAFPSSACAMASRRLNA